MKPTTPPPLDPETASLLETLAGGFFSNDICMCCRAHLVTIYSEMAANIHVANCPVLLARKRLAQNGTPVKFWSIDYALSRPGSGRIDAVSQRVIRVTLSETAALDLALDHIAHYQGQRRLVEGSIRIQEIGVIPIEDIAFSSSH